MPSQERPRGVDGIVPVVPIPFDENEAVDEAALRRLVEFAVKCGVGAICLPAYGSEFYKLTDRERLDVVRVAVEQAAGRTLVIAQSNHGSARVAADIARANVDAGADMISIAVPRIFPLPDDDLLAYLAAVLNAVDVGVLLQDFNPGGPTVSVEFVVRLRQRCPNIRYLKLEEPTLAPKIAAIRRATDDRVGVLEGWGGLYMMELIPAGICGVMPGLAMADILNRIFDLRVQGEEEAFVLFGKLLPQIVFSLQNMELFLYCEKRLLQARGVLDNTRCRSAAFTPDPLSVRYVDELNSRILQAIEEAGFRAVVRQV